MPLSRHYLTNLLINIIQRLAIIFNKGPDSKYPSGCGPYILYYNPQLCTYNEKAVLDNILTSGCVKVTIKLYLENRWQARFGPQSVIC